MKLLNFMPWWFSFAGIIGKYFATNTRDVMIREAISEKKLLVFDYDGYHRIAEPHVYGRKDNKNEILVYQIGGKSSTGELKWKRMEMRKIANMRVLNKAFPGIRPSKGRHSPWDFIYHIVD